MHCCEFCGSEFLARPQVKCPRACNNCQGKRQRANERAWHARHLHFDDHYHRIRRDQRRKRIYEIVVIMMECFRVGQNLVGTSIRLDLFSEKLQSLFLALGVRQINKFWKAINDDDTKDLAARYSRNLVQTSSS